jgi:hypothetical protein
VKRVLRQGTRKRKEKKKRRRRKKRQEVEEVGGRRRGGVMTAICQLPSDTELDTSTKCARKMRDLLAHYTLGASLDTILCKHNVGK